MFICNCNNMYYSIAYIKIIYMNNPYRNNFKPSFEKRSILKTISWKFRIKMRNMFSYFKEWWIPFIFITPGLLLLIILTILEILNERGYPILGYENQEEQQIQIEKDLIKLLEENNRLLKEMKNK